MSEITLAEYGALAEAIGMELTDSGTWWDPPTAPNWEPEFVVSQHLPAYLAEPAQMSRILEKYPIDLTWYPWLAK